MGVRGRQLGRAAALAALVIIVAPVTSQPVLGQASGMGWVEGTTDVGAPKLAGSTSYDPRTQTYTLTGGGTNMWGPRDEFHVAWKRLTGDFLLQTRVRFEGAGVDPHRKVGWIIRPSLDADAAYVDAAIHGDGLTSLQFRRKTGAQTEQIESAVKGPDVVQLERRGLTYIMSVAKSGDPFTRTELADLDLGDEVYVGLFICSHNPAVVEKADFTNIRIVVPPKAGWTPYRDYIGSNLETMPIDTGHRTAVHERRRLDAGAELDARRQGADLQPRMAGCTASTSRPAQSTEHRHRLRHRATTTTTCCRSTARCSASATTAPTTSGSSIVYTLPVDRRRAEADHAAGAVLPARLVAGRRSSWSTPAGATTSSTSTASRSTARRGRAADDGDGRRRRAGVHAGRAVDLLQLDAQRD